MIRINSPLGKAVALTCTFALVFCMSPSLAWAKTYSDAKDWIKSKTPAAKEPLTPSKVLSAKTMRTSQGKTGENPYAAGQSKWDVMYKGVDLMTGNFAVSGTDLTFEGGYGIPVNVTRSYSANNGEGGPLGKGWTLSVDVRSTAGGIMKSSGSPVCSVPTNFKERPSAQVDPNAVYGNGSSGNTSTTSPISAVLATDAGGQEETIQRDADGILSTPPWDKNKIDSVYETIVASNGTNYQVMTSNVVNTPEGTVYVYQKQGDYGTAGVKPFNDSGAAGEPSNVLKIVSATDRHGNATTYTYGTGTVSFVKSNGTTTEHPLTKVHMPNGHEITFTWSGNRMTAASDGVRTVQYGYDGNGNLSSVTTPGGKVTTYGYSNAVNNYSYGPSPATDLMTSVTDPRGLQTTIAYTTEWIPRYGWTPAVHRQVAPNGVKTDFYYYVADGTGIPTVDVLDYTGANYTGPGAPEGFVHGFEITQTFSGANMSVIARQTGSTYVVFTGGNDAWQKDYDVASQNLMSETYRSFDHQNMPSRFSNSFSPTADGPSMTASLTASMTYNFLGNALTRIASEYHRNSSGTVVTDRTTNVAFAYWGSEKYYQSKSEKDQSGRLKFTDYFDNSAAQGKKGQKYRVYDQAKANIWLNTSNSIPGYSTANTASHWRYQVEVSDLSKYSAQFDYDTKGRMIDTWKIQNITSNPWTYVRTHTTYGADTDGSWGQANQITEDYGGINRTIQNLSYDSQGRSVSMQNAAGTITHTTYDLDGLIQSVEKIVGSSSIPLVTYTYGNSGLLNGVVLNVTDEISGVSQSLSFATNGGGKGNIASVTETSGSDSYITEFTYNAAGDRSGVQYTTQSAFGLPSTWKWQYGDFISVGMPQSASRTFQTATCIDTGSGNSTSEEFQYAYDSAGRLRQAVFAQTPQSWTPSSGNSFYDSSHKAATRARAFYNYDGSGHKLGVYHWWDTLQSNNAFTSAPIRANESVFETTGLNRGIKTQNKFYNVASGAWNLQRTESYGYDANLDYLTSANYGDGLAGVNPTWTYDAAGNRVTDSTVSGTWAYDNLNRLTSSPGVSTYSNDILGNRTQKGVTGASDTQVTAWDFANRMVSMNVGANNSNTYVYRADGLRVAKTSTGSSSSQSTVLYRYDCQMSIEDLVKNSSGQITEALRFALGGRGIDAISKATSGGTNVSYPIYDAYGNSVGEIAKAGTSWSISEEKSYDAWGVIRSGGTSSSGKGKYSANLGHKLDDESGLVYMRARYYEPSSGRFLSSDPGHKGGNWYVYCSNSPLMNTDFDGLEEGPWDGQDWIKAICFLLAVGGHTLCAAGFVVMVVSVDPASMLFGCMMMALGLSAVATGFDFSNMTGSLDTMRNVGIQTLIGGAMRYMGMLLQMFTNYKLIQNTCAAIVGLAIIVYTSCLLVIMAESESGG